VNPPFQLSPEVLDSCAQIERALGRCEGLSADAPAPQLRRQNRIRTVQATTAIEGNTLSVDQVTALLEGKRVKGAAREIAEVKNALAAYELASRLKPHSEKDLLRAHATLMAGLSEEAGHYRRGNVGVVTGSRVTHVAPQAKRVPALMKNLFAFLGKSNKTPVLVKACVFHYELEFIHPFSDGNGRVGRLWQHVILCGYSPVFANLPTESLIKEHQRAYYDALARSDKAGDATEFLVFMLQQLLATLNRFLAEFRPVRADARSRLQSAAQHFEARSFSRKQYLALHANVSQATASRDLRSGVEQGLLSVQGDKATARYTFIA
jgi:Fic family protein